MTNKPLVGVVTPVYNGERYLEECIESVLAQTYGVWTYTILDNCSTDRTAEIAAEYAARDPRIRVHRNTQVMPIMENWNAALRLIPAEAKYCKVVHADDSLFPDCLERMSSLAERHASVSVVTSYTMWGDEVRHLGVPYPVEVVDGREVCRSTLRGDCYLFGSPTSLLVRVADIRARETFYDERKVHADTDRAFELLMKGDLGFVHDILTFTRIHPEQVTSAMVKINTFHDEWLAMHMAYGPACLGPEDYYPLLVKRLARYGVFLTKAAVQGKWLDARFRRYHRLAVERVLRGLAARPTRSTRRREDTG